MGGRSAPRSSRASSQLYGGARGATCAVSPSCHPRGRDLCPARAPLRERRCRDLPGAARCRAAPLGCLAGRGGLGVSRGSQLGTAGPRAAFGNGHSGPEDCVGSQLHPGRGRGRGVGGGPARVFLPARLPGQPGYPESPSPPPRPGGGGGEGGCATTETRTPSPEPQGHNVGGRPTASARAGRDPVTLRRLPPVPPRHRHSRPLPGAGCPRQGRLQRGGHGAPHLAGGGCPDPSSLTSRGQHVSRSPRGGPSLSRGGRNTHPGCPSTGRCWTSGPAGGAPPRGRRAHGYQPRTGSGSPFPAERSHGESAVRLVPAVIRCHPLLAAGCRPPRLVAGRGREPAARVGVGREPGGAGEGRLGRLSLAAARNASCPIPSRRPVAPRST